MFVVRKNIKNNLFEQFVPREKDSYRAPISIYTFLIIFIYESSLKQCNNQIVFVDNARKIELNETKRVFWFQRET